MNVRVVCCCLVLCEFLPKDQIRATFLPCTPSPGKPLGPNRLFSEICGASLRKADDDEDSGGDGDGTDSEKETPTLPRTHEEKCENPEGLSSPKPAFLPLPLKAF